jgi:hypothetical protein
MAGAGYQSCTEDRAKHWPSPACLEAFLQPNSRVCRSSNASAVAYRVEQYFIVRRSRRESVRPARKVIRSRELHRLRPPASVVRSLEGEATLGCCLSRQVIRTNQRRLEILSVRASHRFAAQLPLEPAQPLCNYNVCMSSANSEKGSDEHSPSRGRPRLFEELPRHDEIRGSCSRVAREPVLPRSRSCPVQSFEGNSGSRSGPRQHAVQRLLSGARVRKVQSGQGVSRESIIGLAIGLSRDCLTSLRGTCAGQARARQLVSLPKLILLESSADPRLHRKGRPRAPLKLHRRLRCWEDATPNSTSRTRPDAGCARTESPRSS